MTAPNQNNHEQHARARAAQEALMREERRRKRKKEQDEGNDKKNEEQKKLRDVLYERAMRYMSENPPEGFWGGFKMLIKVQIARRAIDQLAKHAQTANIAVEQMMYQLNDDVAGKALIDALFFGGTGVNFFASLLINTIKTGGDFKEAVNTSWRFFLASNEFDGEMVTPSDYDLEPKPSKSKEDDEENDQNVGNKKGKRNDDHDHVIEKRNTLTPAQKHAQNRNAYRADYSTDANLGPNAQMGGTHADHDRRGRARARLVPSGGNSETED